MSGVFSGPFGNGIGGDVFGVSSWDGGALDPLQAFPVNQPGGANYIAAHGTPLPATLTPNGPTAPQFTSPLSWMPRQPAAPGPYNAMAAQLAGPVYTGGLQIPGVSPALLNQPLGASAKGGGPAAGNAGASPAAGSLPAAIQQKLATLRAGGLNNGFVPTASGLSPRGSIQAF